jgi:RNA polymerase sigma-70 factor (ECF subfamily)
LPVPQPDPDLLRRAQRGDEQALTLILRTCETPVHNYVYRMTGDRSLAEDLTQEVLTRVYYGLPRFSLRCKFTTWLFQVTKNRVLDELRARERRPQSACSLEDLPGLAAFERPDDHHETMEAIWRAVGTLNADLKAALLLRDVVGMPYAEIAETLEITLATVKWRIFKAREEVQLALVRDGLVEAGRAVASGPAAA